MRGDLVLQALHFGARVIDPGVDFFQLAPLGGDLVFLFFDLVVRLRCSLRRSGRSRSREFSSSASSDSSCARE